MCQLLGMNCNIPTDICFSFEGFRARGGRTDEHRDGWGIAFFEDRGYRSFIDIKASADSPIADLVRHYPIRSKNVIAHVRKATRGVVSLENTHPFAREMWGRYWLFAHNGDLKDFNPSQADIYQPVGTTDSEAAFCQILNSLRKRFPDGNPSLPALYDALESLTRDICEHGTFNYLLSNGQYLFAHCTTNLCYIVRKAPFREAHLIDDDVSIDFREVTTPNDRVAVIATLPLTDNEQWTTIDPNQLLVFFDGEPLDVRGGGAF